MLVQQTASDRGTTALPRQVGFDQGRQRPSR
jgi:hypothetical protein